MLSEGRRALILTGVLAKVAFGDTPACRRRKTRSERNQKNIYVDIYICIFIEFTMEKTRLIVQPHGDVKLPEGPLVFLPLEMLFSRRQSA